MTSIQESGQTIEIHDALRAGDGTGEPIPAPSVEQQVAHQGITQQEIDAFKACVKPPETMVRVKGGAKSLVPKLLSMKFNPNQALEYATKIAGVDETVEDIIKARRDASIGREEPRFDFNTGTLLQPEAVIFEEPRIERRSRG